jgi:hypothetical protein
LRPAWDTHENSFLKQTKDKQTLKKRKKSKPEELIEKRKDGKSKATLKERHLPDKRHYKGEKKIQPHVNKTTSCAAYLFLHYH